MYRISVGMLGGYGVALGLRMIKKLVGDRHLKPCEEEEEPIPPWGREERRKEITCSFNTKDSELYCFALDTRRQDFDALYKELGEDLYYKVFREPAKGFGRTQGMGGDYEACLDYIRRTEDVEDILRSYLEKYLSKCNLLLPIFSTDGGSGNGFFRYIISLGLKGMDIVPIVTTPFNSIAWNRVRGKKGDFYRKDTALKTIEWLGNLLREGAITSVILTDNDFATYSGMVKRDFVSYKKVKQAFDEIMDEKNFDKFMEVYCRGTKISEEDVDQEIIESILPLLIGLIGSQKDIRIGFFGLAGQDRQNIYNIMRGKFVVPNRTYLTSQEGIYRFLDHDKRYIIGEGKKKVEDMSKSEWMVLMAIYTIYSSLFPISNIDSVYILYQSRDVIPGDVRNLCGQILGRLPQVDAIEGEELNPAHFASIWTYCIASPESVLDILNSKFSIGGELQ